MRLYLLCVLALVGCTSDPPAEPDDEPDTVRLPSPDAMTWEVVALDPGGEPVDLAADGSVMLQRPMLTGYLLWEDGEVRTLSGLTGYPERLCPREDGREVYGSFWNTNTQKDVPFFWDLAEDRLTRLRAPDGFEAVSRLPDGRMVGRYFRGDQGFTALHTGEGEPEDIPTVEGAVYTQATVVSANGVIAGSVFYDPYGDSGDLVVWDDPAAEPRVLPSPGADGFGIDAISHDGKTLYGGRWDSDAQAHETVRWKDGAVEDFPAGEGFGQTAAATNASDWVLLEWEFSCEGSADDCSGALHVDGVLYRLHDLVGLDELLKPRFLNDAGEIVVQREDDTWAVLRPAAAGAL